jgi:hypothetical protein
MNFGALAACLGKTFPATTGAWGPGLFQSFHRGDGLAILRPLESVSSPEKDWTL